MAGGCGLFGAVVALLWLVSGVEGWARPHWRVVSQGPRVWVRRGSVVTASAEAAPRRVAVVGGGWGGWGAAKALCEAGCQVTLIDALPDPTGATPYLSSSGKPVEAGTRGFWKDYPNIERLCEELGLQESEVFTPFTNSSFYSPDGLEATAPVFSSSQFPALPSPLGQVLATFPLFERIPLADRASMVGLLVATLDCLGGDEALQRQYDRMTGHDLFLRFGLSQRLVDDFIRPTLLVGLFKPPEELSALVVMELLYYYALAHQDSFDVRWIRRGTVSSSLIAPLASRLEADYGLKVVGGGRVSRIEVQGGGRGEGPTRATSVAFTNQEGQEVALDGLDGVVMALGTRGMKAVVSSSPGLAQFEEFSRAASLGGIDVISTRLWLDRSVPTRTPANVFSRFPELRGAGGTFFMLDQLQVDPAWTGYSEEEADAAAAWLWGESEEDGGGGVSHRDRGSVVAADFYNAGALLPLADEDLVRLLTEELLPAAVPGFQGVKVVDSWVGRYPGTVSWFSPGSFASRPPLEGAGSRLPNVKVAGDWVRMGALEHGAKGLCQERAYVSGLLAANSLLMDLESSQGLDSSRNGNDGQTAEGGEIPFAAKMHPVIPVRADEPQVTAGKQASQAVFGSLLPRWWVR